jgi:hypothetical protein
MSSIGDDVSAKLKITRGYGKLLGLPDIAHGARVVVLERIGNYEIRMFETPEASSVGAPLFWMELFDLGILSSLHRVRYVRAERQTERRDYSHFLQGCQKPVTRPARPNAISFVVEHAMMAENVK